MANKMELNLLGFIATVMTENNLDLNTMDDVVKLVNEIAEEKYLEQTNGKKENGVFAFSRDEVEKVVINSPTLLKEREKKKKEEKKKEDERKATQKVETKAPTKTETKKVEKKEVKTTQKVFSIDKDKLANYRANVKQTGLFD